MSEDKILKMLREEMLGQVEENLTRQDDLFRRMKENLDTIQTLLEEDALEEKRTYPPLKTVYRSPEGRVERALDVLSSLTFEELEQVLEQMPNINETMSAFCLECSMTTSTDYSLRRKCSCKHHRKAVNYKI